jgi:transcriptional regulator with XRE-family HTH domain
LPKRLLCRKAKIQFGKEILCMFNRIRDIRKAKGMTLADLAAACQPPTTPQTIGRLETGTRQLSLAWINRIAAALGVDPASLVRAEQPGRAQIVAELVASGAQALSSPREALLPSDLVTADGPPPLVLAVSESVGEYRPGDLVWLRQLDPEASQSAINRDCLVPRPGGRFGFGRLIDRRGTRVGLLPPGLGQKQLVVDNPAWIAVAFMLVRPL